MQFSLKLCSLMIGSCLLIPAQTVTVQSAIVGEVKDASGSAIPAADVAAENVGTGGSLKTKSDADGHFRVEHLLPGKYRLTVEATGFKTFVREGLELTGGQTARAP